MRWLLAKDALILWRSRLLVAVLVAYPVAIALLIGLAISRSPAKPRVAIVDETAPGETVQIGSQRVELSQYTEELFSQVDAVHAGSRQEGIEDVRSGKAIATVVIPPDIASRISSGTQRGTVEVLYNGDALEQSLVQSTINSAIANANRTFSEQLQRAAASAIDALLKGSEAGILGAPQDLVGLEAVPGQLHEVIAHQPPGHVRDQLQRIEQFARFAAANLGVSKQVLSTVGQPIQVRSSLLHGRRTPLNAFAVVVAVNVSLMFVAVLLAAGSLALEREERVLGRLVRGIVSRWTLLSEKVLLAACLAFAVALAMLAGVGAFVSLEWSRIGLWLLALLAGAVAFATLGVAVGALAREVRAASLLAFLLSLPLAFLALVPAGAVAGGFYHAIGAISFVFPFKASLQALDAAVNSSSPSLGWSIVHLAGLTLLFGALAAAGMRRAE